MSDDIHDQAPGASDDDLAAISALVDGTATPDERSRVESSDEWAAIAERWREHRSALADPDVVVPPAQVRADALAAAMAVFDELHGGSATDADGHAGAGAGAGTTRTATAAAPAAVIRFDRRRRAMRIVTGAAAAVAVLFVGAAVVGNGFGGSDDEDSASVEVDDAAGKAASTAAAAETEAADAPPAAMDTEIAVATEDTELGDPTDGGGQIEADVESTEAGAEDAITLEAPDVSEAATETTAAAGSGGDDGGVDGIDGPAEVSVTLTSPEQLLDYARSRPAQLPLPGLAFPCVPVDIEALGLAEYRGTQVVVTREPDTGTVEAVDLTTCATIESVTP